MSFGHPAHIAESGKQTVRRPAQAPKPTSSIEDRDVATQTSVSPVVSAALRYAAMRWPVFPCQPGGKAPATAHGFKDATIDPAHIKRLFDRPDCNLGIATGLAGLVVLDIDGEQGRQSLQRLRAEGDIPDTLTHRTRTGGQHLIFAVPPGIHIKNSQSKLADGIDVRAHGGYIVAPPSYVDQDEKGPGGSYQVEVDAPVVPLPEWLASRLLEPDAPRGTDPQATSHDSAHEFPATAQNIERIQRGLAARTAEEGWHREDRWFLTLLDTRSLRDRAGWPDK